MNTIYKNYNFDILTYEDNGRDFTINDNSHYTFNNSLFISTPKTGDLIILSNATNNFFINYIDVLSQKYELVYATNVIGIPYIHPKSILKYLGNKYLSNIMDLRKIYYDNNPFRLPLDTYIFRVK